MEINDKDVSKGLPQVKENSETPQKKENQKSNLKQPNKKKKELYWLWPLKVFFWVLILSFSFSVGSEFVLSAVGIALAVLVIVLLLAVSFVSDILSVAVGTAEIDPFTAMSSKKVKGAKEAIVLVRNKDKVSTIACDVVGDICGVMLGSAGATITLKILSGAETNIVGVLVAASVTALIAALTIGGKSLGKKYAISNSTRIILKVGRFMSLFSKKK